MCRCRITISKRFILIDSNKDTSFRLFTVSKHLFGNCASFILFIVAIQYSIWMPNLNKTKLNNYLFTVVYWQNWKYTWQCDVRTMNNWLNDVLNNVKEQNKMKTREIYKCIYNNNNNKGKFWTEKSERIWSDENETTKCRTMTMRDQFKRLVRQCKKRIKNTHIQGDKSCIYRYQSKSILNFYQ